MANRQQVKKTLLSGGAATLSLLDRALATQSASLEVLLPFSDASGLVAVDVSGNNRNGTYTGVGITYGQPSPVSNQSSVLLDPTAGNVFIDTYNAAYAGVPAAGEFSVMICFDVTAFDTDANGVCAYLAADANNRFLIGRSASYLQCYHIGGGTTKSANLAPTGSADWLCCVVTVSAANDRLKWFINGYKVWETTGLGTWVGNLNSATTLCGAQSKTGTSEHPGGLYGFGLWSTELSESEAAYISGAYQAKCYLDSVGGNDTNSGLTAAAPVATLAKAFDRLLPGGGVIHVSAGVSNPLTTGGTWAGGGKVILQADANWYMDGSTTYTSGWTDAGGGVYSRAITNSPGIVVVTTIAGEAGLYTILTQNTVTPTTPAAGEYGHAAGTLYVHLPADASANANTIKVPTVANLILATDGILTIDKAIVEYAYDDAVELTVDSAILTNCEARYAGLSGFGLRGGAFSVSNCLGEANRNDGFNVTGNAIVTLNNCEGGYNQDEGASPHNTSTLSIVGGQYHHSGQGGITAVQDSTLNISGVIVNNNGRGGEVQGAGSRGGINYSGNTGGGTCENCVCQDNTGEGFYCNTIGVVTVTNLTSGLAEGNTLADDLC